MSSHLGAAVAVANGKRITRLLSLVELLQILDHPLHRVAVSAHGCVYSKGSSGQQAIGEEGRSQGTHHTGKGGLTYCAW